MLETNTTGASPTTIPRTPDRTSNEETSSDHTHAENESVSNNDIGQHSNLLTSIVADVAVHGARGTAVALQRSCLCV